MTSPFDEAYNTLSEEQKLVVNTIEGAVMVIAGPGSGKTQVLTMRIANILRSTDTDARNILCLTFTDAASENMRQRLSTFVGTKIARQVNIKTFHSFSQDIIRSYPEYFGFSSFFHPINALDQKSVLKSSIDSLTYNHPLKSYHPSLGYVYINALQEKVSDLKRAGLFPEEFHTLLHNSYTYAHKTHTIISEILTKPCRTVSQAVETADELLKIFARDYSDDDLYTTLPSKAYKLLQHTITTMKNDEKPSIQRFTEWRNLFFSKDAHRYQWKILLEKEKWEGVNIVYKEYCKKLHTNGWIDFDDMILLVSQKLKQEEDLRLQIQEQFQYILVDEFQDNNLAQNSILYELGNNSINEGNPNILVVGDDDQSIFKFGGASMTVLEEFAKHYPRLTTLRLSINYRSNPGILSLAQSLVDDITDRYIRNKTIYSTKVYSKFPSHIHAYAYNTTEDEYDAVASMIAENIRTGVQPSTIAIIGRTHKQLRAVASSLEAYSIPCNYNAQESVFDHPIIQLLLKISRYVVTVFHSQKDIADELLPDILTHPAWNIPRIEIWKISIAANKEKWIHALLTSKEQTLTHLGEFLLLLAQSCHHLSAVEMIHTILGLEEITLSDGTKYTSPLFQYFFGNTNDLTNIKVAEYAELSSALDTIIHIAHSYRSDSFLTLDSLIQLLDSADELGINLEYEIPTRNTTGVHLLTAHGAKGLEFDMVYIIDADYSSWMKPSRTKLLQWPVHIDFSPDSDTENDFLRVLYVAITRAKHTIIATYSLQGTNKKQQTLLHFFEQYLSESPQFLANTQKKIHIHNNTEKQLTDDENTLLRKQASKHVFSVTSIVSLLDLANGGPQKFIERNLLCFPTAITTNTRFGNVIHSTLENMFRVFVQTHTQPTIEKIIQELPEQIRMHKIRKDEYDSQLERAKNSLSQYLPTLKTLWNVTDKAELLLPDGTTISDVPVSGKIDHIVIKDGKAIIIDYKTGKPLSMRKKEDQQWFRFKYTLQYLIYSQALEKSQIVGKDIEIVKGEFHFFDSKFTKSVERVHIEPTPSDIQDCNRLLRILHKMVSSCTFPTPAQLEQYKEKDNFTYRSNMLFYKDIMSGKNS